MPDNPNSYLPQSAAPLGQGLEPQIRPLAVGPSVPNPLDVTNFYRMQESLNSNLRSMQTNIEQRQRQQTINLAEREQMIKEVDSFMGMMNGSFASWNQDRKTNKDQGMGSMSGMFGSLDPRYAKDAELINRYQDQYEAMQNQVFKIGQSYLANRSADPASRMEAMRQIQGITGDFNRQLMMDKEFLERDRMGRMYNTFLDQVEEYRKQGYDVDTDYIEALTKRYEDYANGVTTATDENGNPVNIVPPSMKDFDISNAVYQGKASRDMLLTDAASLSKGYEQSRLETLPNGDKVEVKERVQPTRQETIDALSERYRADKGMQKQYEIWANRSIKPDGTKPTFEEFIEAMVGDTLPQEGEEITNQGYGQQYEMSRAKGGAGTTPQTREQELRSAYGDTDGGRRASMLHQSLESQGYDVNTARDGYYIMQASSDPEKYEIIDEEFESADGVKGKRKVIIQHETDDKGKRIPGEGTKVYTINPKPQQINTGTTSSAAPKGMKGDYANMDSSKWAPDKHFEGEDKGSRNNNPGNVRPKGSELKEYYATGQLPPGVAGIDVTYNKAAEGKRGDSICEGDECRYVGPGKGNGYNASHFMQYETIEAGKQAQRADLDTKLAGKSTAMKSSKYMIDKYGQKALENYEEFFTLQDYLNVYAPAADSNNPSAYVAHVEKFLKDKYGIDIKSNRSMKDYSSDELDMILEAMIALESPDSYDRLYTDKYKKGDDINAGGATWSMRNIPERNPGESEQAYVDRVRQFQEEEARRAADEWTQ